MVLICLLLKDLINTMEQWISRMTLLCTHFMMAHLDILILHKYVRLMKIVKIRIMILEEISVTLEEKFAQKAHVTLILIVHNS